MPVSVTVDSRHIAAPHADNLGVLLLYTPASCNATPSVQISSTIINANQMRKFRRRRRRRGRRHGRRVSNSFSHGQIHLNGRPYCSAGPRNLPFVDYLSSTPLASHRRYRTHIITKAARRQATISTNRRRRNLDHRGEEDKPRRRVRISGRPRATGAPVTSSWPAVPFRGFAGCVYR